MATDRNDLAVDIGYVGNLGRHQVIPIPFNQPGIATPASPIHGQQYTYGYQVVGPAGAETTARLLQLPNGQGPYLSMYEGGNVDLRVPYVGYSSNQNRIFSEPMECPPTTHSKVTWRNE